MNAEQASKDYEFDYRNRLVRVTERPSAAGAATSIVEFKYDAFDRRTGKQVDSDGDGDTDRATAWAWDGNQVVLQYADADGDGPAMWKLTNRYLYGEAIDQILADEQSPGDGIGLSAATLTTGDVLWPLGDHLGSVRDLVDASGVIREHVVYDSFGNRLSESDYDSTGASIASSHASAVDHLFGYTGREWDADVELQYNRARWYDPTQGRWISQDPIGFAAGDTNLYRYVGNLPTTKTDPSGLESPQLTPEEIDEIINSQPTVAPLVGPRGGISLGAHGNGRPAGYYGAAERQVRDQFIIDAYNGGRSYAGNDPLKYAQLAASALHDDEWYSWELAQRFRDEAVRLRCEEGDMGLAASYWVDERIVEIGRTYSGSGLNIGTEGRRAAGFGSNEGLTVAGTVVLGGGLKITKNPPISPAQSKHTGGPGSAGRSQFNRGVDVEGAVRMAWEAGRPIFDKNGRFIGKRFTFKMPIGKSPSGHDQCTVMVHFGKEGIHGVPSTRP